MATVTAGQRPCLHDVDVRAGEDGLDAAQLERLVCTLVEPQGAQREIHHQLCAGFPGGSTDRNGDLAIDDCELAASQFMEVCKASLFLPFVFQAAPAPSPDRIDEVVDSSVRMFLAAYRAK